MAHTDTTENTEEESNAALLLEGLMNTNWANNTNSPVGSAAGVWHTRIAQRTRKRSLTRLGCWRLLKNTNWANDTNSPVGLAAEVWHTRISREH